MHPFIRPATAADTEAIVRVVKAVFDEYGFTWEAEGYHADLYDVQTHYFQAGHEFYVGALTTNAGETIQGVIALHLFDPIRGGVGTIVEIEGKRRIAGCDCSLDRLYVHPSARRSGLGTALARSVVARARELGRRQMEIWSDKRFVDAHRLYGRLGAEQVGDRILDDPDESPEWGLMVRL